MGKAPLVKLKQIWTPQQLKIKYLSEITWDETDPDGDKKISQLSVYWSATFSVIYQE